MSVLKPTEYLDRRGADQRIKNRFMDLLEAEGLVEDGLATEADLDWVFQQIVEETPGGAT